MDGREARWYAVSCCCSVFTVGDNGCETAGCGNSAVEPSVPGDATRAHGSWMPLAAGPREDAGFRVCVGAYVWMGEGMSSIGENSYFASDWGDCGGSEGSEADIPGVYYLFYSWFSCLLLLV